MAQRTPEELVDSTTFLK